jgi:hypothetical protein
MASKSTRAVGKSAGIRTKDQAAPVDLPVDKDIFSGSELYNKPDEDNDEEAEESEGGNIKLVVGIPHFQFY